MSLNHRKEKVLMSRSTPAGVGLRHSSRCLLKRGSTFLVSFPRRWLRPILILLYILFLISAFLGAVFIDYQSNAETYSPTQAVIVGVANGFGICALIMIVVQYILSARLKLLQPFFALNNLLLWHGWSGAVIGLFVFTHLSLMYVGTIQQFGPSLSLPWPLYSGIFAAFLLWIVVVSSLWRLFLKLPYPNWLSLHRLSFIIFALAMIHGYFMGDFYQEAPVTTVVFALPIVLWTGLIIRGKVLLPRRLAKNCYTVTQLVSENHDTNTLVLEGPEMNYLPGQFSFLTLIRKGKREEEHPFTICWSPTRPGLRFTIKNSGDYTSTISETLPGDKALVDGPYGRFSYYNYPSPGLLFIAGGVGITPIMSMLWCLADENDERPITLIWGNKQQRDIFFNDELKEIEDRLQRFRRIDVLSAEPHWPGEKGFVDVDFLKGTLKKEDYQSQVFLCGPPIMMKLVTGALREIGFSRKNIHTEKFSLFW